MAGQRLVDFFIDHSNKNLNGMRCSTSWWVQGLDRKG